jgi:hypothetical protein
MSEISQGSIKVPTVFVVPLNKVNVGIPSFAIYAKNAKTFQPYLYLELKNDNGHIFNVIAPQADGDTRFVLDKNYETYIEFPIVSNSVDTAEIVVKDGGGGFWASGINLSLDRNVALPTSISVDVLQNDGTYKVVLSPIRPDSYRVLFPKTFGQNWRIKMTYGQPLRISEISFIENDNEILNKNRNLYFLAQPDESYEIYFNADRYVPQINTESGNLLNSKNPLLVSMKDAETNPLFERSDADGDGVVDILDNCVITSNKDQADVDKNGRGDACEDFDLDGLPNNTDNCPNIPNRYQEDQDGDNEGDVCDDYENRTTERLPWLPWLGIGLAGVVIVGLLFLAATHKKEKINNSV